MFKFFRKIRKELVEEKKLSQYLIYAIGEIILVVIGILIALAINNYNENRILKAKEQTYLIGLKNEFEISKSKLQELINVNKRIYEGALKIVGYISAQNEPPNEKQFSEVLYNTFAFDIAYNPNNSLLYEMINSGSLKDISNTSLRKHFTNWISTIEDISKQEYDLRHERQNILDIFRSENYSLRTILDLADIEDSKVNRQTQQKGKSNLSLLKSTKFENNILMFTLTSRATEVSHYQPLLKDLNIILEMIDREIRL